MINVSMDARIKKMGVSDETEAGGFVERVIVLLHDGRKEQHFIKLAFIGNRWGLVVALSLMTCWFWSHVDSSLD